MSVVIGALNTKGGVGKTTTLCNIGPLIASLGGRVLMIDADVQRSLTKYYPTLHSASKGLTDALIGGAISHDHISTTIVGVDLIGSDVAPQAGNEWLAKQLDRDVRLYNLLRSQFIQDNYDYVLIDSQGALSPMQTAVALASDIMLYPVLPQALTLRELQDGAIELFASLRGARIQPKSLTIAVNRLNRTKDSTSHHRKLRAEFVGGGGFPYRAILLDTTIPELTCIAEATSRRLPLHWVQKLRSDAPNSSTDPGVDSLDRATSAVHNLLWEILPEFKGMATFLHCDGATNIVDFQIPERAIKVVTRGIASDTTEASLTNEYVTEAVNYHILTDAELGIARGKKKKPKLTSVAGGKADVPEPEPSTGSDKVGGSAA